MGKSRCGVDRWSYPTRNKARVVALLRHSHSNSVNAVVTLRG